MVIYREKLLKAKEILQKHYSDKITQIILEDERPVLKIEFNLSYILYIRYNYFDEYSYQLIFSQQENDRIRFDNYDQIWDVSSKPNHFHPRGKKVAIVSPMNGNPDHDIPILFRYIPV